MTQSHYLPTYLVPCYRVCLQLWSWCIHYGFPRPSYHMEACLVKAPKDLRENSGRLHSRNVYIPNERGVWAVPSLLAVDANPLFPHSHPLSIFHQSFELVLTRWRITSILLLLSSCKPSLLVLLIVSLLLPLSSHSLLNKAEYEYLCHLGVMEVESKASPITL